MSIEGAGDLKVKAADEGVPNKELESPSRDRWSLLLSGESQFPRPGLYLGRLSSRAAISSSSLSVGLGTRNTESLDGGCAVMRGSPISGSLPFGG